MLLKIERDHQRFQQIVRGQDPRGPAQVHHPRRDDRPQGQATWSASRCRSIDIPHFRYGDNSAGGVGQGDGEAGDAGRPGDGRGRRARPASEPGAAHPRGRHHARGAGRHPRRGAASCRASSPRASTTSTTSKDRYTSIRQAGPESLRHFKRTFQRALQRQIIAGTYDPDRPRIIVPIREDKRLPLAGRRSASRRPTRSSST